MEKTIERQIMKKVYLRLLPFSFGLYFICYLDRVNMGFASLTMNKDIGLSAYVFLTSNQPLTGSIAAETSAGGSASPGAGCWAAAGLPVAEILSEAGGASARSADPNR